MQTAASMRSDRASHYTASGCARTYTSGASEKVSGKLQASGASELLHLDSRHTSASRRRQIPVSYAAPILTMPLSSPSTVHTLPDDASRELCHSPQEANQRFRHFLPHHQHQWRGASVLPSFTFFKVYLTRFLSLQDMLKHKLVDFIIQSVSAKTSRALRQKLIFSLGMDTGSWRT